MFSQFVFVLQTKIKRAFREVSVHGELTLGHLSFDTCAAPTKLATWLSLPHRSVAREGNFGGKAHSDASRSVTEYVQ